MSVVAQWGSVTVIAVVQAMAVETDMFVQAHWGGQSGSKSKVIRWRDCHFSLVIFVVECLIDYMEYCWATPWSQIELDHSFDHEGGVVVVVAAQAHKLPDWVAGCE